MWAVKWQKSDWHGGGLMGKFCAGDEFPVFLNGYKTMVFATRKEAQAFIKERWGYIAKRTDLRQPPHNWRMPKPVRVTVQVTET
jgi:hypothetical protein